MSNTVNRRYDFTYLFDVQDGNPNGDPDAGNLPRIDAETGMGLVTDVCLKRKIRNYVQIVKGNQKPHDIYVKEKAVLSRTQGEAYEDESVKAASDKSVKIVKGREYMCRNFFDIRTFGAVMSLKTNNCGQVRGPIQLVFGRSIEPVVTLEHSITRMAVATEEEAKKQKGDNRTMGRKYTIPYGLYRTHGFVSAHLAEQTGFTEDDLKLFWESLINMFEHDRSAARGLMTARGLYVFEHDSALGNAPAHTLFDRIEVTRANGDSDTPARSFADYQIQIDEQALPEGVKLHSFI
ncbi:type I-C CRISPR-associated protein Cas7/Csd2 [Salinispira pacifica]|uniref:CRISPR-associated protein, TM1801 family n=1 Tax=Salinispira pacifica TaxID=1307761 RepID=V5WFS0_9SPIO|nr:type I-C CRISPR-associated protein Cas7/Csd2 [Salinispira pacifica]AHC14001.1 CRISPR-associated protein, TM1801 family [Salinispira pacifica]